MRRLIAAILVDRGNVVQTRQFKTTNIVGNVKTAARFFNKWDVDEILMLNISRYDMTEDVKAVAREIFLPLTVGGGVKSLDDMDRLFKVGADKIAIGQHATYEFIHEAAERYGSQAVTQIINEEGEPVYVDTGEVLYNCRVRDGMKNGFDLEGIRRMADALTIPLIAMGGAGMTRHFVEAAEAGADAVAAGNLFHYAEHATVLAKRAMKAAGIQVRDAVL